MTSEASPGIQPIDILYTAIATAENARDGRVASHDGKLDVIVNPPTELGGNGAGTNPEQMFAGGFAACFAASLGVAARQVQAETTVKPDVSDALVTAVVHLGRNPAGGLGLAMEVEVTIPHVDEAMAKDLVKRAHAVCPYSIATAGNINVDFTIA